jgi:hypothetical protein
MGRAAGQSVEKRKGRKAGSDPQRRRAAMGAAHLRYGGLSAAGKKALVHELVVITGYHRKSVLRALNRRPISVDGDDISGEPHRHHR